MTVKPWADRILDNDVKGATVAMLAEIEELRSAIEKSEKQYYAKVEQLHQHMLEIDKLRKALYDSKHCQCGYDDVCEFARERDDLRTKLTAIEANKSFAETHPANPNATCKCEHWQSCPDCHPTAHKYNPAPVYTSNCSRHPAAPHGIDVEASFRAGKNVCICQSWKPGDAS